MFSFKKKQTFFIALMVFMLFLTACGSKNASPVVNSDAPAESEPATQTESTKSTNSDSKQTIIYKATNGDIEVPINPQRIVVDSKVYVGYFLALGIKPIGVPEEALHNPYFDGLVDGINSIGEIDSSLEYISSLEPDLIITITRSKTIEQFEKIAPTIAIEYGEKDFREQLLDFGVITGKEAEAKAWIERWDAKIAENKPKVESVVGDKTVSILQPSAKGIYAFGHNYGRGGEILYGEFHLKAPEIIQTEAIDSGVGYATLSMENLPQFAGDYIFTSPWTGDASKQEDMYETNIWKSLPAVKNDHVYWLDPNYSNYSDPVSLESHLDFILKSLLP